MDMHNQSFAGSRAPDGVRARPDSGSGTAKRSAPALVLALCFITYSLVYIGRLNFSIAAPLFEQSGMLGKDQIGMLGSTFFLVYALGRVINGSIGDRFAPKPFLVTGLALSALCNFCFALLPDAALMYVIWGLNGYFQSMLWGAALRNVSMEYPDPAEGRRAAVILSVSVGVGSLLGVVVPTILAVFGVRTLFWVPGALLLMMCAALWLLLPAQEQTHAPAGAARAPLLGCLKSGELRRMLFPTMVHGAIKENITLWIPLLFTQLYGLDLTQAAFYIFMMPLATFLGRLLFPVWQRICGRSERATLVSAFLAGALCLLPLLFFTPPIWLCCALLALLSVAHSIINAELISVYPVNFQATNEVSTVSGILDCAAYIGSALGATAFGFLILVAGYQTMLGIWGVLSVCALLPLVRPAGSNSVASMSDCPPKQ